MNKTRTYRSFKAGFILFLVLLLNNSYAQNKAKISLEKARDMMVMNPDSAILLVENTKKIALEIKDYKTLCAAYNVTVIANLYLGEYDRADSVAKVGIQICEKYKQDSVKGRIYAIRGINAQYAGNDSLALSCYRESGSIFKKLNDVLNYADSYNNLGVYFNGLHQYDSAEIYFKQCLQIAGNEKSDTLESFYYIASANTNLATIAMLKGQYLTSQKYLFDALNYFEILEDSTNVTQVLLNIGSVYYEQGNFVKADEYLGTAADYSVLYSSRDVQALVHYRWGNTHQSMKNYELALNEYKISKSIYFEQDLLDLVAMLNNSIGSLYLETGDLDSAEIYLEEARIARIEDGDTIAYYNVLVNLSVLKMQQGNVQKAKEFIEEVLRNHQKTDEFGLFLDTRMQASNVYEKLGKHELATKMLREYIVNKDSSYGASQLAQISEMEGLFQLSEKNKKIELLNLDNQLKSADLELQSIKISEQEAIENQRRWQLMLAGVGILGLGIFGFILFKRNKEKKEYNVVLEKKNDEIREQHIILEDALGEIKDSIRYAERIQRAILPPLGDFQKSFEDHFVMYLPKDVVAGDFYWHHRKDDLIIFAAADCTGHGVPGAMVSVICNGALNKSVKEHQLLEPGKILDKTRQLVIEEFEKSESEVKDGMDISLCAFNPNTRELKWSGANNPLWILRKDGEEIEVFKPNKQPIGKSEISNPFDTVSVQLEKGDSLYIFSDGFVDQFGGPKGKKFMASNFRNLLLSLAHLSMKDQLIELKRAFENWRQNHEQIDDVCVIGVRV